jgi:glycerol-3-phosphate acyltransferase PlsY
MIIVVITVPMLIWQDVPPESLLWAAAIILLVIWRHKGNIGRMIKGTEEKVST